MPVLKNNRPTVFKVGDTWAWTCSHWDTYCYKIFPGWGDSWTAAMVSATVHWAEYHDQTGEVIEEGQLNGHPVSCACEECMPL